MWPGSTQMLGSNENAVTILWREKPNMVTAIQWCELHLLAYEIGVDSLGQQVILLRLAQTNDYQPTVSNFHKGQQGELTVGDVQSAETLTFSMTIPYERWQPVNQWGCTVLLAQGLAITLLELQALPVTNEVVRETAETLLGYLKQKHALDDDLRANAATTD